MPRRIRIVILIVCRLAFFIVTKVLLFLLSLPFIRYVSLILAKFARIPLALKQLKAILQTVIFLSFTPLFIRKRDEAPQMKSATTEPKISIGERIRTWRQRYSVEARNLTARLEVVQPRKSRKRIEHVEFEAPSQEINKIVCEPLEALEPIHISLPQDIVHLSSEEYVRQIKDEEYARLSAEKQVYEKFELSQFITPPTPPKDKPRPPTPPPKSPDNVKTSSKESSKLSAVLIGPSSGEDLPVSAPPVPYPQDMATPYSGGLFDLFADDGDMNVNSSQTVNSKDEYKAFMKGGNIKEGMDGDKITANVKWFQHPSFPPK